MDCFTKFDDPTNMYADRELTAQLAEKQSLLEELTAKNMKLKLGIDDYRRNFENMLQNLKTKLGIQASL
jgi:cell division protein FtsB